MTDDARFTRRRLLGAGTLSLGALGLGFGGQRLLGSEPVTYTRTTLAQGEVDLRVDWREWYNGTSTEQQDEPTDNDGDDPVVVLEDVLPGDDGRLAFGLSLADETTADRARLEMRVRAFDERENGVTEPEERAGDGDEAGELAEHVSVFAWYDTGISAGDTPIYGACDGTFDPMADETLLDGSLAAISSDAWVPLDANPDGDDDCLDADEGLCLALEWALPEDLLGVDDNVVQSDSVRFEIAFRAADCAEL